MHTSKSGTIGHCLHAVLTYTSDLQPDRLCSAAGHSAAAMCRHPCVITLTGHDKQQHLLPFCKPSQAVHTGSCQIAPSLTILTSNVLLSCLGFQLCAVADSLKRALDADAFAPHLPHTRPGGQQTYMQLLTTPVITFIPWRREQ